MCGAASLLHIPRPLPSADDIVLFPCRKRGDMDSTLQGGVVACSCMLSEISNTPRLISRVVSEPLECNAVDAASVEHVKSTGSTYLIT